MWIRSQNKQDLVKVVSVHVFIYGFDDFRILATNETCTKGDYYKLGKYETHERALEVLDDIQEHIEHCHSRIYKMPAK